MTTLDRVLRRLVADLDALELRWALVGGLAVSARAEPRTTRDVDIALDVTDDLGAEQTVLVLRQRGYGDAGQMLEHEVTGRLSTMRMVTPSPDMAVVDLMFASTGIEPEIVLAVSARVRPRTRRGPRGAWVDHQATDASPEGSGPRIRAAVRCREARHRVFGEPDLANSDTKTIGNITGVWG